MKKELAEKLDVEISDAISELSGMSIKDEKYSTAADNLQRLCRIQLDQDRFYEENKMRNSQLTKEISFHVDENKLKKEQFSEQKKEKWFRVGLTVFEVCVPIAFYSIWMHKGLEFEKNGNLTSPVFRNLWSKFKPTKK